VKLVYKTEDIFKSLQLIWKVLLALMMSVIFKWPIELSQKCGT